jgi:hypothetical protein
MHPMGTLPYVLLADYHADGGFSCISIRINLLHNDFIVFSVVSAGMEIIIEKHTTYCTDATAALQEATKWLTLVQQLQAAHESGEEIKKPKNIAVDSVVGPIIYTPGGE